MTTLFLTHFLYCSLQCYTHNLLECNWGCYHFSLLQPLPPLDSPASRDHQRIWPKMFSIFISVLQSLHDYWNKNFFLVNCEERFVWQNLNHHTEVFDYSLGDTIGPCVQGSDSISQACPTTDPTNKSDNFGDYNYVIIFVRCFHWLMGYRLWGSVSAFWIKLAIRVAKPDG